MRNDIKEVMDGYDKRVKAGLATKHSTHDSIFYISKEGGLGFKVIKFYDCGIDYRISGYYISSGEAYSEAILYI